MMFGKTSLFLLVALSTTCLVSAQQAPGPAPSDLPDFECNAEAWTEAFETEGGVNEDVTEITIYSEPNTTLGAPIRTFTTVSVDDTCIPLKVGVEISKDIYDALPAANETAVQPPPECVGQEDPFANGCPPPETSIPIPFPLGGTEFLPFTFMLLGWAPLGHPPFNVYSSPHFDLHFYDSEPSDLGQIIPGPCVNLLPEAWTAANEPIPAECFPEGYVNLGSTAPFQGNHYIDMSNPEFMAAMEGEAGTSAWNYTIIYGGYDGEITFMEPMIKESFLKNLEEEECHDFPSIPEYMSVAGYYPTKWCATPTEDAVLVWTTDFVMKDACSGGAFAPGSYYTPPPGSGPLPAQCVTPSLAPAPGPAPKAPAPAAVPSAPTPSNGPAAGPTSSAATSHGAGAAGVVAVLMAVALL